MTRRGPRLLLVAGIATMVLAPAVAYTQNAGRSALSPATATWISIGTLVAPFALARPLEEANPGLGTSSVLAGLYLAPMAGYWYAGMPRKGLKPMVKLLAIDGIAIGGAAVACASGCGLWGDTGNTGLAVLIILAGGVTHAITTIASIGDVYTTVKEENAKRVVFTPTWSPQTRTAGLAASLHF